MSLPEYYYNPINNNYGNVNSLKYKSDLSKLRITDDVNSQKVNYKNRLIGSPIYMQGGGGGAPVDGAAFSGSWNDACTKMGKWYEQNIHTYQGTREKPRAGRHWYDCPLINRKVQDDCSAFVWAVLQLFKPNIFTERSWGPTCVQYSLHNGETWLTKQLREAGFNVYQFSKANTRPGDIINGAKANGAGGLGHVEIYTGGNKSWSWGSVHDGQGGKQGMPCNTCWNHGGATYIEIWRLG